MQKVSPDKVFLDRHYSGYVHRSSKSLVQQLPQLSPGMLVTSPCLSNSLTKHVLYTIGQGLCLKYMCPFILALSIIYSQSCKSCDECYREYEKARSYAPSGAVRKLCATPSIGSIQLTSVSSGCIEKIISRLVVAVGANWRARKQYTHVDVHHLAWLIVICMDFFMVDIDTVDEGERRNCSCNI